MAKREREEERAKLRRLQNLRSKDAGEQTGDEAEAATTGEEDYNAAITCSSLQGENVREEEERESSATIPESRPFGPQRTKD